MKLAKAMLVASALALSGAVVAADKDEGRHIGFNEMDKNDDGRLTREEVRAAGNTWLLQRFDEADKAGTGYLTRGEYLAVMGRKDLRTAQEWMKEKVQDVQERVGEARNDEPAAAGAGSPGSGNVQGSGQPR
ncbi:MAG TPA: hypothetical protein VM489_04575 [Burkholderiales bacterium]|nr:hypothetical protein [Burkholderiales bacterium]